MEKIVQKTTLQEKILLASSFTLTTMSSFFIGILIAVTRGNGNELFSYIVPGIYKQTTTLVLGHHFNLALVSGITMIYGLLAISGALFMGGHVLMKVYYKKMSNLEKSEVVRWIILMVGFIALLLILGYMFTQAWFR
jgi:hypothetical protein